jgi:hypothetical protein
MIGKNILGKSRKVVILNKIAQKRGVFACFFQGVYHVIQLTHVAPS